MYKRQDRYLPDKAIDALDEAGSRVHLSNLDVPKYILDLETELSLIKQRKNSAVKNQNYEEAASFRDKEKIVSKYVAKYTIEKNQPVFFYE